jgi:hypothetical protein
VREAAAYLQLDESKRDELATRRELPAARLGGYDLSPPGWVLALD